MKCVLTVLLLAAVAAGDDALLAATADPDPGKRWRAWWELRERRKFASPLLNAASSALDDSDSDVRAAARVYLASAAQAGRRRLETVLRGGSVTAIREAALACAWLGKRAISLRSSLEDNIHYRWHWGETWDAVCRALARMPSDSPAVLASKVVERIVEDPRRGTVAAYRYIESLGPDAMRPLGRLMVMTVYPPRGLKPGEIAPLGYGSGPRRVMAKLALEDPVAFARMIRFERLGDLEWNMASEEMLELACDLGPLTEAGAGPRLLRYYAGGYGPKPLECVEMLMDIRPRDRKIVKSIIEALPGREPAAMLDLVAAIGPPARGAQAFVRKASSSTDPDIASAARVALARLRRPSASEERSFLPLLHDAKPARRARACLGLGAVYAAHRELEVGPGLVKALVDRDRRVVAAAATALAGLGERGKRYLPRLAHALTRTRFQRAKVTVVEAMLAIDPVDSRSIQATVSLFGVLRVGLQLRLRATVRALRKKGRTIWLETLKGPARQVVVEEILAGRLKGDDIARALLPHVGGGSLDAARALAKLGHAAEGIAKLKPGLAAKDPEVRRRTAAALVALGADEKTLAPAFEDPVLAVRIAALR